MLLKNALTNWALNVRLSKMPKHIKTPDPDSEYTQRCIRLVRLGSTIYLYLKGVVYWKESAHPVMTRKCGNEQTATEIFYRLKMAFRTSCKKEKKKSLRDRLHDLWWWLTE